MRSIRARFDSRTLSQLRLDSRMGNSRMLESSSNRAHIESNRNCDRILESNRARIVIVTEDSIRFELDSSSIRIRKKLNMFILFSNARIERISNRIAIVTGFSNRIELESNAYRARIELESQL